MGATAKQQAEESGSSSALVKTDLISWKKQDRQPVVVFAKAHLQLDAAGNAKSGTEANSAASLVNRAVLMSDSRAIICETNLLILTV